MGHHGILVLNNIAEIAIVQFLHTGQRPNAPPRLIPVRVVPETEPVAVGGVRIGNGAISKNMLRVEIDAVTTCVGEDAVQNDPQAKPVRLRAHGAKVFLRAQHGVRPPVIGGVVAVVGIGHENGIQIDETHAKRL